MKKSNIALLAVLVIAALSLTSYESGPAHRAGLNCTGAESDNGNPIGCSTGNCHGASATPGIVVTIEIDSAGAAITKYTGGATYTVKLTGTNTTSNTDGYFGFQLSAITGSTRSASPTNAGTWQQSGLPSGVQYTPAQHGYFLANVIEQSTALSATSGTGGTGTVYSVSVNWTAPAAGTGTVSFWAALNAVDGIDVATGILDFWNTQSLVLEEDTGTTAGVNTVSGNISVNIYPNPSSDFVQIEMNNASPSRYEVNAYNTEGCKIATNTLDAAGDFAKTTFNTSNWAAGIYLVQITNGPWQKVIRIVKS